MKFEMTHEFAYPAETVWEMMHDPDSHVAKFERMGHTDMEVLSSEVTDTSLDLVLRRQVEMEIPSVAKKFLSPSNTVTSNDHWEDRGDGSSPSKSRVPRPRAEERRRWSRSTRIRVATRFNSR